MNIRFLRRKQRWGHFLYVVDFPDRLLAQKSKRGSKLFLYNGTSHFVKFKLKLIDGNTEKVNKTKILEEKMKETVIVSIII